MAGFIIECEGASCRVVLRGNLTAAVVPDLQTALRSELSKEVSQLSFDLGQTAMLDSTGIGLLIAARNSVAKRNGSMRVTGVSADILHLLQSMRLVERLNVQGREAVAHG